MTRLEGQLFALVIALLTVLAFLSGYLTGRTVQRIRGEQQHEHH
jgi:hypothetical protein